MKENKKMYLNNKSVIREIRSDNDYKICIYQDNKSPFLISIEYETIYLPYHISTNRNEYNEILDLLMNRYNLHKVMSNDFPYYATVSDSKGSDKLRFTLGDETIGAFSNFDIIDSAEHAIISKKVSISLISSIKNIKTLNIIGHEIDSFDGFPKLDNCSRVIIRTNNVFNFENMPIINGDLIISSITSKNITDTDKEYIKSRVKGTVRFL